jgi:hypothetical protein
MDLKDFVSTALVDIIEGIKTAQAKTDRGTIVPSIRQNLKSIDAGISKFTSVEFEVAVQSEQKSGSKARLSVGAAIIGGAVAGESNTAAGHVAKLKFRVPVRLPLGE